MATEKNYETIATMRGELKPCPFCGSPAELRRYQSETTAPRYYVLCGNRERNCACSPVTWVEMSRRDAVLRWNNRYNQPIQVNTKDE